MLHLIPWKHSQLILIRSVRCETQLYTLPMDTYVIALSISFLMFDGQLELVKHMEMMIDSHFSMPLMIWLIFNPLELFVA